jgi:hypothetical protein
MGPACGRHTPPRADAWAFWSDLRNHMRLEPGVERIELDGPFATGTTGRTVAQGFTHEWRRSDVVPELRFACALAGPDGRTLFMLTAD